MSDPWSVDAGQASEDCRELDPESPEGNSAERKLIASTGVVGGAGGVSGSVGRPPEQDEPEQGGGRVGVSGVL